MRKMWKSAWLVPLIGALVCGTALAQVEFEDPAGDDNGPGEYVYPTDAVYKAGSFDLTALEITTKGKSANVAVSVNSNLEDPWGMDVGFAVQMVFVFIDNAEGGYTDGPPGTNVKFAEGNEWDKCIVLSPQTSARVKQEVEAKAEAMMDGMVVPSRTTGSGRTITGRVKLADLGEGDPATWGYQVIMQSNEGFPSETDLLTRKVNEFEGQHRYGGGTDYDCDPHVMDILGDHAWLKYECKPDGTPVKMATLKMVKPGS